MCLLCMYEHGLVQLFLSKPLLVKGDLLTYISNINTSLCDSDMRKSRRGERIVTKEEKELVWVPQ